MSLPNPSAEVVKSIEGAIKWFQKSKIKGGNYTLITQNRKIFPNIIWILCK
jgi:hypothetical protein